MSETNNSFRELRATDHSLHYLGRVLADDTTVEFRDELPLEAPVERYVFANGFTGTMESMALPRCVAAHEGYDARALGSSHNHPNRSIERYAGEIIAVAGVTNPELSAPEVTGIHLVGVSMGGAAVLVAARDCPNLLSVDAQVPACVSRTNQLFDLILGTSQRKREFQRLMRHDPGFALRAAVCGIAGVLRRPLGVAGEMVDLATRKVSKDIQAIQAMEKAPHIRITVGDEDGLIRKAGVIAAARELGVEVWTGKTGHVEGVLTDAEYTREIIRMNLAA